MPKWLRNILIVVAAIIALVACIMVVAPPITKAYINRYGEQLLGRKVELEGLKLNVLSGHLKLSDLTLYEDDGKTAFVSFDKFDIKVKLLKLLSRELYIKHLGLDSLSVNLVQDGSDFNFNSLVNHFKSDNSEPDTTPSEPWVLRFYDIKVLHAKVKYNDLQRSKEWDVHDLNIMIPGFVIGTDDGSEAGLTLALADGGTLKIDANVDKTTNDFKVYVDVSQFALSNLKEYISPVLNVSNVDGAVDITASATGNVSDIANATLKGAVRVDSVMLKGVENKFIAGLDNLIIDINQINLGKNIIYVNELAVDGLRGTFERYDDHTNFSALIPQSNSAPDTTLLQPSDTLSVTQSEPLDLKVGHFELKNSQFTYVDHTLPEPFDMKISKIHAESENLTLAGQNAAKLSASLPGGGHLFARWAGRLDDWKQNQDLTAVVKGLDMKQFSPWLLSYFGMPCDDGIFGFTSHNTINSSVLSGNNKIDIYNLELGKRRKDVSPQLNLPLKAALYILKDKDNKILLDVPISGNIDSPEFNYMKLVWKTLQNLLIKVATSPARALGNALGINTNDLTFIAIDEHQRGFSSEQYHQFGDLAKIATYDTTIVLTFDLQVPPTDNDTIVRFRNMHNESLRKYMLEQGVLEDQIVVTTTESTTLKKSGYSITSSLKSVGDIELPDDEL
ncbi:MAG: DUF748 domain-containing protein [Bacteroidales bacterium]|nr:DUF748 domain-containing protein [Bacteroidales bacterium]